MPKPKFVLDIRTKEPIAICCDDKEQKKAGESDPERISTEQNCIMLAPTRAAEHRNRQNTKTRPKRITVRPGRITLFYEFRNLDELLSELPRFARAAATERGEGGCALLSREARSPPRTERTNPIKQFSESSGYNVHLTVYDY